MDLLARLLGHPPDLTTEEERWEQRRRLDFLEARIRLLRLEDAPSGRPFADRRLKQVPYHGPERRRGFA